MFEMKPEYYTGIEFIDVQHKRLFDLADEAYNLLNNDFIPDKYDHVKSLVNELRKYTAVHFADEEAYMESIGYKRKFSQKIDHENFLQKINEINLEELEGDQQSVIFDLLTFLNNWLVEHIFEKDMLIGK